MSTNTDIQAKLELMERRLDRETQARKNAEQLLFSKSQELYEMAQRSSAAQQKLELALWAAQEAFWEWHAHNDSFESRSFEFKQEDVTVWKGDTKQLLEKVHPDDVESLKQAWSMAVIGDSDKLEASFRMATPQGFNWIRLRGRVLSRQHDGQAMHIVGTSKDITQERSVAQSFNLMASAFSASREPMLILTPEFKIREANQAFLTIMGADKPHPFTDQNLKRLIDIPELQLALLKRASQVRFESKLLTGSDQFLPVEVSLGRFDKDQQEGTYLIATLRDMTERVNAEKQLQKLAMFDDLTGLPNRNGLREHTAALIDKNIPFSMLFIDLDRFKQINDAAGHSMGDKTMQQCASKLEEVFAGVKDNVVARWGGDEFSVLLPNVALADAKDLSDSLISSLQKMTVCDKNAELKMSASVGLVSYPQHGEQFEALLQNADAAMHQAKSTGKSRALIYETGLLESIQERVSMLSELKRSIYSDSLEFFIQGKYDLSGTLQGGELLCRWSSALHGPVPPNVFIPLAEKNELDGEIGWLALRAACRYLQGFAQYDIHVDLSINVSANQLLEDDFPERAAEVCRQANVETHLIEIELTESIFIRDQKRALLALKSLHEQGFKLALDDFGSGFASLGYLNSFDFEVVKLDRVLVKDIVHDRRALSLFNGIIAMLQNIGVKTVVEGVEDEAYLPFLSAVDVNLVQGFYFDKPMPYDQFVGRHSGLGARFDELFKRVLSIQNRAVKNV